jgi:hypothetical protein
MPQYAGRAQNRTLALVGEKSTASSYIWQPFLGVHALTMQSILGLTVGRQYFELAPVVTVRIGT